MGHGMSQPWLRRLGGLAHLSTARRDEAETHLKPAGAPGERQPTHLASLPHH